jgi:dTDP-glucose 4,6-dehydratase
MTIARVAGVANLLAADLDHVLVHTGPLWDDLRGGRVFITGGTGFFGCWLLETFAHANDRLSLGAEAIVLTRDPAAFARKAQHLARRRGIGLHEGDVRSFTFPKGHFSHVIHAATDTTARPDATSQLALLDTILGGTRRTLESASRSGSPKVLITSSGGVYGRQPSELTHIPEEWTGAPDILDVRSAYGEGKRVAEYLAAASHSEQGLPVRIARCFAFVGPHLPLDAHFAIGNFVRDGLAGQTIKVGGDGTPYRSYLYAADLAIWLWTILIRGENCRPYNVGSDCAVTIGELARCVADYFGVDVTVARMAQPGRAADRYVPAIRRAEDELRLRVRIPLKDAIARTAEWHKAVRGPGDLWFSPSGKSA